ncbi:MAG: hypothetical protein JJU06_13345 [Ectothiorhodospiraceae bacterium]|nr:hypothetical protein [Ectothiorhodospiraceae bacterium]
MAGPVFCKASNEPLVDLGSLTGRQRREAWAHIQRHHPALAELLQAEAVQDARREFDAAVMVDASVLPPHLRNGA